MCYALCCVFAHCSVFLYGTGWHWFWNILIWLKTLSFILFLLTQLPYKKINFSLVWNHVCLTYFLNTFSTGCRLYYILFSTWSSRSKDLKIRKFWVFHWRNVLLLQSSEILLLKKRLFVMFFFSKANTIIYLYIRKKCVHNALSFYLFSMGLHKYISSF